MKLFWLVSIISTQFAQAQKGSSSQDFTLENFVANWWKNAEFVFEEDHLRAVKNFADSKIDPSVWSHIFSGADCDQDGFVNKEELTGWFFAGENVPDAYEGFMPNFFEKYFDLFCEDGDGQLGSEEFKYALAAISATEGSTLVVHFDADNNGELNGDEIEEYMKIGFGTFEEWDPVNSQPLREFWEDLYASSDALSRNDLIKSCVLIWRAWTDVTSTPRCAPKL